MILYGKCSDKPQCGLVLTGRGFHFMKNKMTVKAVTRNVNIPFTFYGIQDNLFNPKEAVAGFEARFTFDRLAYHVGNGKFMKMGVVGQAVDVVISMEMIREK